MSIQAQTPIIKGTSKKGISFKYEWFNPIYFHIRKYLSDGNIRRILLMGGSSASKSHSALQALSIDGYIKNYSTLIFRKEQASIKDTVKNELVASLENARMYNAYQTYEFEFRSAKGTKMRLRGLDKEGKVKGLKGYKKLYFDELDHFTFKDWSEAGRRLRGEDNQQII
ncbi:MAG: phage terminase large subunit, partial [Gelidibacter sp.]|nr:phage terminase large subunit [Gelidibacter sp.]